MNVQDARRVGLAQRAAVQRPQFADDAKQRRLAAPVGTSNHAVDAALDFTRQRFDEQLAVGRDQIDVLQRNAVGSFDLAAAGQLLDSSAQRRRLLCVALVAANAPRSDRFAPSVATTLTRRCCVGCNRCLIGAVDAV